MRLCTVRCAVLVRLQVVCSFARDALWRRAARTAATATNRTRKTTNRILAMPAAPAATPVNPSAGDERDDREDDGPLEHSADLLLGPRARGARPLIDGDDSSEARSRRPGSERRVNACRTGAGSGVSPALGELGRRSRGSAPARPASAMATRDAARRRRRQRRPAQTSRRRREAQRDARRQRRGGAARRANSTRSVLPARREDDARASLSRAPAGRAGRRARRRAARAPNIDSIGGAVHPRRRAGVPAPAAAPDVRRGAVDVAGHHVGLDRVAPARAADARERCAGLR